MNGKLRLKYWVTQIFHKARVRERVPNPSQVMKILLQRWQVFKFWQSLIKKIIFIVSSEKNRFLKHDFNVAICY